jgi:hypothetical protein
MAGGTPSLTAMRAFKRRLANIGYIRMLVDQNRRDQAPMTGPGEGARPAPSPTPALRTSHFTDPHPRRYPRIRPLRRPPRSRLHAPRDDAPEPSRCSAPPDERPNGQMIGPSLRTTRAPKPLVKIARPARPEPRLPRSDVVEHSMKTGGSRGVADSQLSPGHQRVLQHAEPDPLTGISVPVSGGRGPSHPRDQTPTP